ncbi:MAG: hypothetical protein IT227_01980 [Flavobacteriales bacterium]|nr:hypothetical protein [Flavobacteriales bacterium]
MPPAWAMCAVWKTAAYLRSGALPHAEFVAEECHDPEEAERLAAHYERIMESLLAQKAAQE